MGPDHRLPVIPDLPVAARGNAPDDQRNRAAKAIRERLTPPTPALDLQLRRIVNHSYPKTLWQLDFELHGLVELDSEVDITAYFYAPGYKELLAALPLHSPLVLTLPPMLTESTVRSWQMDPRSDESHWLFDVAQTELIGWFAERWHTAAAGRFNHRATVAAHDAEYRFDLISWEWSDSL